MLLPPLFRLSRGRSAIHRAPENRERRFPDRLSKRRVGNRRERHILARRFGRKDKGRRGDQLSRLRPQNIPSTRSFSASATIFTNPSV